MNLRLNIFLLLLFSAICFNSFGETFPDKEENNYRKFNQASLDEYIADSDFHYIENQNPKINYVEKLRRWIFNMLRAVLGSQATGFFMSNFHYILMAIALFLIIYKISGLSFEKLGYKVKKLDNFEADFDTTPIEEINFQQLIADALSKKDYRQAIRFQYLDVLKSLSEKGLISHSRYKSNVEYAYELKDDVLKNEFRQLVFTFDHIWYGEYPVNAEQYQLIHPGFDSFKKQISGNGNQQAER